jgi:hypothetical protein
MRKLSICSLAAVSLLAGADRDPGGWTAAKWGMTPGQIVKALPGQAVQLTGPEQDRTFDGILATVGVPALALDKDTVRIFFICDPSAGLVRVEMRSADDSDEAFVRLESLLVQKYGKPWSRSTDQVKESQWSFPTTTITLRRVEMKAISFRSLWITYARRDATDKLE